MTPLRKRAAFNFLVTNVLGDVLVKKSIAVWQCRTEILRTVWLYQTDI